jgi:periplasmic protein TonB
MAAMGDRAFLPTPRGSQPAGDEDGRGLFTELVVSKPSSSRGFWAGLRASAVVHGVVLGLLVLVPILWPSQNPDIPDPIRALIYNPPAAAAAPLPKGSALTTKVERPKPVTPDTTPQKEAFTIPVEIPREKPLEPEHRASQDEQSGSPTGSDSGIAEGMEGGVEGGVAGGVLNGVVGGCVGCTGDGPVLDYDEPPKPLILTKPQYPQDAFVKKIEGTVVLEILIDATGRVVHARVLRSVPLLDAAARETVMKWTFSPAMKHGRPVATYAQAPVAFRIF